MNDKAEQQPDWMDALEEQYEMEYLLGWLDEHGITQYQKLSGGHRRITVNGKSQWYINRNEADQPPINLDTP